MYVLPNDIHIFLGCYQTQKLHLDFVKAIGTEVCNL